MTNFLLVDSHCHLDFADFDADREDLIDRANATGIGLMVSICTQVSKRDRILEIAERFPCVYASIGTHPLNAADEGEVPTEDLVRLSGHPKVVAIGEAGLDYHYDRAPHDLQERVFRRHIEAARVTGLPLVIHARDADEAVERILCDEAGKGAFPFVLHCFTRVAGSPRSGSSLGAMFRFPASWPSRTQASFGRSRLRSRVIGSSSKRMRLILRRRPTEASGTSRRSCATRPRRSQWRLAGSSSRLRARRPTTSSDCSAKCPILA